jgi:hypothetical protein
VITTERHGVLGLVPQTMDDLELFLEHRHPGGDRRQPDPECMMFFGHPSGSDAEFDPTARGVVDGRDDLR